MVPPAGSSDRGRSKTGPEKTLPSLVFPHLFQAHELSRKDPMLPMPPSHDDDQVFFDDSGDFTFRLPSEQPRAKKPTTTSLRNLLEQATHDFENHVPPVRWPVGDEAWGNFYFRPNSIITVGGPTNVGKTSLALNSLCRAMKATPELRVLVANNESRPQDLMNRLLAMESGVNLQHIRTRNSLYCTASDFRAAAEGLNSYGDRLEFMEMPFTLEDISRRAEEFRADIVCVDVLQKLRLEDFYGDVGDTVGRIMAGLRDLANMGPCVLAIASVSREGVRHLQKRVGRRDHDELDACVFLHSSEIETTADAAFILLAEHGAQTALKPDEEYTPIPMWLQHLKARDDMRIHVPLLFDGRYQRFSVRSPEASPRGFAVAPRKPSGARAKKPTPRQTSRGGDDENWLS